MSYQPGMTMKLCRQAFALAIIFIAMPARASDELQRQEPDTVIFAMMSGKCSTLKVAGRDLACRAVAFFQTEEGRANFTVAIDDPSDDSHIITFSGDNGRRPEANLYELPIDRMLLKSKDRPKADGLPVPSVESTAGLCKQVGNFVTLELSSITCSAVDKNGKKYELQYQSDGAPMAVRRIKRMRVGSPAVSPFDDVK
ncbi:hypothetical protein V1294_001065 [Bradyrhizobium sp. AZCC 1678]|jgi:hypothetical protein|uniref:Uncharacterized protein n=1 Tax=Bradyrhizobium algeriense TaxID=634784 RepID=A0ABU8BN13_9BRAD|nr:hypothetical protein [Bradyrhizobium algeriense]